MIAYKGYKASVCYEPDDRCFHGTVDNILDVVHFSGSTVEELETAFHESVDDYIAFCREVGKDPERPYLGEVRIHLPKSLYRCLKAAANQEGESLDTYIIQRLKETAERHLRL